MSKSTFRPPAESTRLGEFPIGRDSRAHVDLLSSYGSDVVLSIRKHVAGAGPGDSARAWHPTKNGAVFAVTPERIDALIALLVEARAAIVERQTGDYLAAEALEARGLHRDEVDAGQEVTP